MVLKSQTSNTHVLFRNTKINIRGDRQKKMKVGMEQYWRGDKQGPVFIVLVSLLAQPDYRMSADSTFSLIPFVFSLSLSHNKLVCVTEEGNLILRTVDR